MVDTQILTVEELKVLTSLQTEKQVFQGAISEKEKQINEVLTRAINRINSSQSKKVEEANKIAAPNKKPVKKVANKKVAKKSAKKSVKKAVKKVDK